MNKRTLGVNYTRFQCLYEQRRPLRHAICNLAYVKNESRSTALSRFIDAVNRETCKVHNLLQPFEVSNYHLFVISVYLVCDLEGGRL